MSLPDVLKEADRIMVICNSCRYCEGFCAVFPAMERRRIFSGADLKYLANLCHNCRGCYYACQYAPPHEFDLNVPKTLGELRIETYREFAWPAALAGLFRRNGLRVSLITGASVLLVGLLTLLLRGPQAVFTPHLGENAFYRVMPYWALVLPLSALGLFAAASLLKGIGNFWRETGAASSELFDLRAHGRAIGDVLQLKYLDGGGHGCNYPDDRFRFIRKRFHHFVFYGFILCFVSTTIAAFYDHFLHQSAPYPFWSFPVVAGTAGGLALVIGTVGLLYLKLKMDRAPAPARSLGMDVGLLLLLLLTAASGLLLLWLRTTAAMGMLLSVHVGFVVALFITLPYGKFIHTVYRYSALVRNALEKMAEEKSEAAQKNED